MFPSDSAIPLPSAFPRAQLYGPQSLCVNTPDSLVPKTRELQMAPVLQWDSAEETRLCADSARLCHAEGGVWTNPCIQVVLCMQAALCLQLALYTPLALCIHRTCSHWFSQQSIENILRISCSCQNVIALL